MSNDGWAVYTAGRAGPAAAPAARGVPGGARAARVSFDTSAEASETAGRLAEALVAAGRTGGDLLLALPSSRCLCARFDLTGLPRRRRRQAMLYRLEECLPLAAEDVAADFIPHGGRALGVCTEAAWLAALLAALQERRVHVAAVSPISLLALQALLRHPSAEPIDALIWRDGSGVELLALSGAKACAWQAFSLADGTAVEVPRAALAALAALAAASPQGLRVATIGLNRLPRERVAALPGVRLVSLAHAPAGPQADPAVSDPAISDPAIIDLAVAEAARVLAGAAAAPVDLRPAGAGGGAVAVPRPLRRPLASAAAAAALLLAAAVGGTLWRAGRYAHLARTFQDEKVAAFRRAFPGQQVPQGIEARLRSAERRLRRPGRAAGAGDGAAGAGSAGGAGRAAGTAELRAAGQTGGAEGSALLTLREALSRLPGDVRYRLTEIQFDGRDLTLRGEVLTHADADRIASALREAPQPGSGGSGGSAGAGGFVVDEPQSRTAGGGRGQTVEFSLHAAWPGPADRAGPADPAIARVAPVKGAEP